MERQICPGHPVDVETQKIIIISLIISEKTKVQKDVTLIPKTCCIKWTFSPEDTMSMLYKNYCEHVDLSDLKTLVPSVHITRCMFCIVES